MSTFKKSGSIQCIIPAILFLIQSSLNAQYAPPAGQPGSTALHKDSSIFVAWATGCTSVPGFQNIADSSLGRANVGTNASATGKAGGNGILSLGDGGVAVLTFLHPIKNGPGFDFAVFENSFHDSFLELAFVEVSSDGINFFRFPSHSLTDTLKQVGTFTFTNAGKINNLAGKYRALFGTPFDLEEMQGIPQLDPANITHVRIIDVVGSIDSKYCSRDTAGRKINDPWPTPFPSSGFDLDAVGVIHQATSAGIAATVKNDFVIFPNPVKDKLTIRNSIERTFNICIKNQLGIQLYSGMENTTLASVLFDRFSQGIYILEIRCENSVYISRIIKSD